MAVSGDKDYADKPIGYYRLKERMLTEIITVLATSTLAPGVSEEEFVEASDQFQSDFVSKQPGVLRRELLRKESGGYIEIIQFRSAEDLADVLEKEKTSEACHAYLKKILMDDTNDSGLQTCASLATYP